MTENRSWTWRYFGDGFDLDRCKLKSEKGFIAVSVRDLSRPQTSLKLLFDKEIAEEVWLGGREGIRNWLITAA
jgi:hypothetical protein